MLKRPATIKKKRFILADKFQAPLNTKSKKIEKTGKEYIYGSGQPPVLHLNSSSATKQPH